LSVRPSQSFHQVTYEPNGLVTSIAGIDRSDFWINGGFFIFRNEIFDYMHNGEELVIEPFQRLIAEQQLVTYRNPGFGPVWIPLRRNCSSMNSTHAVTCRGPFGSRRSPW